MFIVDPMYRCWVKGKKAEFVPASETAPLSDTERSNSRGCSEGVGGYFQRADKVSAEI